MNAKTDGVLQNSTSIRLINDDLNESCQFARRKRIFRSWASIQDDGTNFKKAGKWKMLCDRFHSLFRLFWKEEKSSMRVGSWQKERGRKRKARKRKGWLKRVVKSVKLKVSHFSLRLWGTPRRKEKGRNSCTFYARAEIIPRAALCMQSMFPIYTVSIRNACAI